MTVRTPDSKKMIKIQIQPHAAQDENTAVQTHTSGTRELESEANERKQMIKRHGLLDAGDFLSENLKAKISLYKKNQLPGSKPLRWQQSPRNHHFYDQRTANTANHSTRYKNKKPT